MNRVRAPGRTARVRLREHLLAEVAAGKFQVAEPLPSENQLAERFGVCRNTVRHAFSDLEQRGVIHRIRGKGTFLRATVPAPDRPALEMFALVLPEVRRTLYPSLIRGFGRAAEEGGQQLMVAQSDDSIYKQAEIVLQLIEKQVAGVAIVPTTVPATPVYHIRHLQRHKIPVVFCHRAVPGASAPCITWNWEEVGQLAGRELLTRGHRRIAFLGRRRYTVPEAYVTGLRKVMEGSGVAFDEKLVAMASAPLPEEADAGQTAARQATTTAHAARLLELPDRPTAFFCHDESVAEELYLWAVDRGLRIPDDLSIICAADAQRDGAVSRRLACVGIDEARVGAYAAEILQEMVHGKRQPTNDQRVYVPTIFSAGETLGSVSR